MSPRVRLSEWEQLLEHLRRFGQSGTVRVDDGLIQVDFGTAHVEIRRDGTVETGMSLHDFSHDETTAVVVDHEAGTLAVESDVVNYTFRRPGG